MVSDMDVEVICYIGAMMIDVIYKLLCCTTHILFSAFGACYEITTCDDVHVREWRTWYRVRLRGWVDWNVG